MNILCGPVEFLWSCVTGIFETGALAPDWSDWRVLLVKNPANFLSVFLVILLCLYWRSYYGCVDRVLQYNFSLVIRGGMDAIALCFALVLFAALLVLSKSLLGLFLSWVGLNVALYGLLANHAGSLRAQEAAMKYFILGLLVAVLHLFGV